MRYKNQELVYCKTFDINYVEGLSLNLIINLVPATITQQNSFFRLISRSNEKNSTFHNLVWTSSMLQVS